MFEKNFFLIQIPFFPNPFSCSARFLWKRIPLNIKNTDVELEKIHSVYICLWNNDIAGFFKTINYEWSNNIAELMFELRGLFNSISFLLYFLSGIRIILCFFFVKLNRKNIQRNSWIGGQSIHVIVRGFSMQHVESDTWCYNRTVQQFGVGNSRRQFSTFDSTTSSTWSQSQYGNFWKFVSQINWFCVIFGKLTLCDRFNYIFVNPKSNNDINKHIKCKKNNHRLRKDSNLNKYFLHKRLEGFYLIVLPQRIAGDAR